MIKSSLHHTFTFDPYYQQVNWFATICLVCVLVAVASIYAGALDPRERVK